MGATDVIASVKVYYFRFLKDVYARTCMHFFRFVWIVGFVADDCEVVSVG